VSDGQADGPKPGDDMVEMPGHRWVKIGAEDESVSEEALPATDIAPDDSPEVVVEIQPISKDTEKSVIEDSPEDMMERMTETIRGAVDMNQSQKAQKDTVMDDAETDDSGDPVYDLFELGAVEYGEQTPSQ